MQHARALHRAMNVMRHADQKTPASTAASAPSTDGVEPIVGRYLNLEIGGERHRVFFEEAGVGIPLFCLHTAGADSGQYRHLLNDTSVTSRYRVIAFDMPYHGRSNPPDGWWLRKYLLKPRTTSP
jgi:pimeloyl-ACP methyl ester carboxylesterase